METVAVAHTRPLPLRQWRWVVVNSSAGKDSQTALAEVVRLCDAEGLGRDRIVVSHQCLGRMEWPGTLELAELQARHYGLRFEVSKYRNRDGDEPELLDYVRRRGKWPDSKNRYCTSDFKRGPGGRVVTALFRESVGDILQVFGFRAEESPARAKRKQFAKNTRLSTLKREVWDWLPIHGWTEARVWSDIRDSGVPWHWAYDKGMPRLSCVFCVFAPKPALIAAGIANPGLLDEYCALEADIKHTFQNGRALSEIRAAIAAGAEPESMTGAWNM